MANQWIDISVPLRTGMVHWPGDATVTIERVVDMDRGVPAGRRIQGRYGCHDPRGEGGALGEGFTKIMVAGEPEHLTEQERRQKGVPLSDAVVNDLTKLGVSVGIPFSA